MAVERKSRSMALWVVLLAVGLTSVMPFGWIIFGSFTPHLEIQPGRTLPCQEFEIQPTAAPLGSQPPADAAQAPAPAEKQYLTLDNYRKIADQLTGLPTYYFNTVYLSMAGTFLSLLVGSLAAYGFAQFKFPLSNTLFAILLLTIMIPAEVCLIGQYELMFQLRLFD